ncbi:hypothetical protein D3C79_1048770 [compost metagenome]
MNVCVKVKSLKVAVTSTVSTSKVRSTSSVIVSASRNTKARCSAWKTSATNPMRSLTVLHSVVALN